MFRFPYILFIRRSGNRWVIREIKISDAHFIHLLNKEGLGYDYPEEKMKIKLQKIMNMETDKIFVAEIDNKVIGHIHGSAYV